MGKLPYENYIFDLYGTLVDIHTEEDRPEAWAALARFYSYYGADYAPGELQQAFRRMTANGRRAGKPPRRESHEACPEIEIEEVFLALFRQKGAAAGRELARARGAVFPRDDHRPAVPVRRRARPAAHAAAAGRQGVPALQRAADLHRARDAGPGADAVLRRGLPFLGLRLQKAGPPLLCTAAHRAAPEAGEKHHGSAHGRRGLCDIEGARQAGLATLYVRSNLSPEEDWPQADFTLPAMDIPAMGRLLTGAAAGQPAPL